MLIRLNQILVTRKNFILMRLSYLSTKSVRLLETLEISNLELDTKLECNMSTGASVLFCDNELMFISQTNFLLKPLLQYVFMGK